MESHDCYLCGKTIAGDDATVAIPRLALKVHLSCYERDVAATKAAPRTVRRRRSA